MKSPCIRNLAFKLIAKGRTRKEVAEILEVNIRTIFRWLREGSRKRLERAPRLSRRRLTSLQEASMSERCQSLPATSIKELVRFTVSTFAIHVSISTAARILARAKFTYKKAVKRNSEYNEETGRQFVREIISPLLCGLPNAIASVDEAGFHLNCAPKYGWAKRGQRAVITRPMVRGMKFSLLLCVRPKGTVGAILVEGAVTSVIFRNFLESLPQGLTLILDNCSIHKATKSLTKIGLPTIKETAVNRSIALQYAVPYAPYLNPVEYVFQSIRQHVIKVQPRTALELGAAITTGIKAYKPSSLKALFQRVVQNDGRVGA